MGGKVEGGWRDSCHSSWCVTQFGAGRLRQEHEKNQQVCPLLVIIRKKQENERKKTNKFSEGNVENIHSFILGLGVKILQIREQSIPGVLYRLIRRHLEEIILFSFNK